ATALALLAAAIGRVARLPALGHILWLVVLLKFITPPLVKVSVPLPEAAAFAPTDLARSRTGAIRTEDGQNLFAQLAVAAMLETESQVDANGFAVPAAADHDMTAAAPMRGNWFAASQDATLTI